MAPEPAITEPPAEVVRALADLRDELDAVIPAKQVDRNLLVATWNVRAFGDVTKKWRSAATDTPKRDLRDVRMIAEIVSRFDVVAIQEVKGNLRGLRHMLKALGPDWGVILTDVTKGSAGNGERLAFVFDSRRVRPSGLAAELVVPAERNSTRIRRGALDRQFARTPYAVSFAGSGKTFILVTLHVDFGKKAAERIPELTEIASWLGDWAEQEEDWNHNLIALGDFNIDRSGDPLYDAFTSTGLEPASGLNDIPRSIFDKPTAPHFYDQIAWFTKNGSGPKRPVLSLTCSNAGTFDFVKHLRGDATLTELSWRISDHYPLWVEFSVRD